MGHLSKIFEKIPLEIQRRNGFDLSHINCGTAKCGQLTPVLKRLLMPATKFSLGCSMNVELPPLATSFMGRVDAVVEVFFCPCSILYGGWKQFISNQIATMFPDSQEAVSNLGGYALPLIRINNTYTAGKIASLASYNDGLMDYLGFNFQPSLLNPNIDINMLPFLAYHRICDVFYRNPQVTKTWFAVNPNPGSGYVVYDSENNYIGVKKNVSLVWHSYYASSKLYNSSFIEIPDDDPISTNAVSDNIFSTSDDLTFPDNISILEMRQRPWSRDYFTSALLDTQQGNAPQILVNTGDDGDYVSISQIRAANSLQKFLEANNLDQTYAGVMRNHFGVRPSDADLDEPMYLGRLVVPVYQKGIYQQNVLDGSISYESSNPFVNYGLLGAKGAHGSMSGEGSIVESFKVNCFGYLMGLFSLVPHTMYNYGIDKDLLRAQIGDFPFPELQSVGMDKIEDAEVYIGSSISRAAFAYTQRYAYEKYINDQCHGELRPGKTLQSFVLQRSFAGLPEFSTQFTLIPKTALDGVFAANVGVTLMSCWYEIFWVFKASMPLAEYSIPTLGDLKDTYTIHTTQGGSRL